MQLPKYFFACALLVFASFIQAQDSRELSNLTADNRSKTQQISAAEAELTKYSERIASIKEDIDSAQKALDEAKQIETDASAAYRSDASPANKRDLDSAKSSLVLAERKVASLSKRLTFSEKKKAEAESVITSNLNAISANNTRIDQLSKEIASREAAKAKASAPPPVEKVVEKAPPPPVKPAEPAPVAPKKQPEPKPEPVAPKKPDPEQEALTQAQKAVSAIEAYLAETDKPRGNIRRPFIVSSLDGRIEMDHLGGEIYFAEVRLRSGKHRMGFAASTYRVVVEDAANGELFRLYVDNRDSDTRKLLVYKSSLLDP